MSNELVSYPGRTWRRLPDGKKRKGGWSLQDTSKSERGVSMKIRVPSGTSVREMNRIAEQSLGLIDNTKTQSKYNPSFGELLDDVYELRFASKPSAYGIKYQMKMLHDLRDWRWDEVNHESFLKYIMQKHSKGMSVASLSVMAGYARKTMEIACCRAKPAQSIPYNPLAQFHFKDLGLGKPRVRGVYVPYEVYLEKYIPFFREGRKEPYRADFIEFLLLQGRRPLEVSQYKRTMLQEIEVNGQIQHILVIPPRIYKAGRKVGKAQTVKLLPRSYELIMQQPPNDLDLIFWNPRSPHIRWEAGSWINTINDLRKEFPKDLYEDSQGEFIPPVFRDTRASCITWRGEFAPVGERWSIPRIANFVGHTTMRSTMRYLSDTNDYEEWQDLLGKAKDPGTLTTEERTELHKIAQNA